MKKKWLCLLVFLMMVSLPASHVREMEIRGMLARALSATAGASPYEVMLALGSVAMNRAVPDNPSQRISIESLAAALDEAGFSRGHTAGERATRAAEALFLGQRTLPDDVRHFWKAPPEHRHIRVGAFHFS